MRHSQGAKPVESTNGAVTVSLVTMFDGVKLYRVEVDGKYVYVATTGQGVLSTRWDEYCGKGCIDEISVPTVAVRMHAEAQR